jgi:hypothetical protein
MLSKPPFAQRSPWIKLEECVQLAQGILLELQAKGFEIVKRRT